MLSEFEKRAAALAVSRYGADRLCVQEAIVAVQEARARGENADLLDVLRERNLLSAEQCDELHIALDETRIDPTVPRKLDAADAALDKAATAISQTNGSPVESVEELRQLGEFRLLRRLGEGGMGAVYLGYHEEQDRHVAVKVLSPQFAGNQALVDRFYREAKSGALLNHPNIVRNLAVGQDRITARHYLVLEYVDGQSAQTLLDQMGRLSVGDAVHIVVDIARALEHAHSRNIVHRDIKPANILITQSGLAKLADLGLARRTDETSHLTAARQGFGTPYYMPYEQAMNARLADARSDLFALGATLYHLLTGDVPFPGTSHLEIVDRKNLGFFEPASTLSPEVPPNLDQILARLLAREPRDRYQTASELIVDLDRSGLSAMVPSFVDAQRALQDPLVRQRLLAPAQPTTLDALHPSPAGGEQGVLHPSPPGGERGRGEGAPADFWFLRYRDRQGRWCKAKASLEQVLQRVRDGKLKGEIEASPTPEGEFLPLARIPQFQGALADRARLDESARGSKRRRPVTPTPAFAQSTFFSTQAWWLLAVILTAVVLVTAIFMYLAFRPS